jgi:hypothetical protein
MRVTIETNGFRIDHADPLSIDAIKSIVGTDSLESFDLPDGIHRMYFDEEHLAERLPLNQVATKYHWDKIGAEEGYIAGDVVIVPHADFL